MERTLRELTEAVLVAADAWAARIIQAPDDEKSDLHVALLNVINVRKAYLARGGK